MAKFYDPCAVYALFSSRDGVWRYVGQTEETVRYRLYRHVRSARDGRTSAVARWVREEIAGGFEINAEVLTKYGRRDETERLVIAHCREIGLPLLNQKGSSSGRTPEGGSAPTARSRAKMAAAKCGYKHSAETRAKIGASRHGVPFEGERGLHVDS